MKDIELKKSERVQVWKDNQPDRYEEIINRLDVWYCGELVGHIEGENKSYRYYTKDAKYFNGSSYCPKRKWAIQDLIFDALEIQIVL